MLLFFAIATGLIAAYLLAQSIKPLLESGSVTAEDWQRVEDESLDLLNRRDRLIEELRELEFEAALDKIDKRDLEALRRSYEAQAISLDRQLEEQMDRYDARIDAAVQQTLDAAAERRAGQSGSKAPEAKPPEAKPPEAKPPEAKPPEAKPPEAKPPAAGSMAPDAAVTPTTPATEAAEGFALILPPSGEWPEGAHCQQCDNALDPDAAFCDGCGARVMKACVACGAPNRPGARFCKTCGASQDKEAS